MRIEVVLGNVTSAAIVIVAGAVAWIMTTPSATIAQAATPLADQMLSRPCVKPEICSQTWTLASRLGHILDAYEARLGPRNPIYRLLGVEFTTSTRPRTWYPDFGKGPRNLIVQLTRAARRNRKLALFQLGHEAFHVIEPITPGSRGSYLEEGLANYFAIDYMKRQGIRDGAALLTEKEYRVAFDLVVRVASLHSDFDARLKRMREVTRSFSQVTSDDIRAAFPNAPAQVARQLAARFPSVGTTGNKR